MAHRGVLSRLPRRPHFPRACRSGQAFARCQPSFSHGDALPGLLNSLYVMAQSKVYDFLIGDAPDAAFFRRRFREVYVPDVRVEIIPTIEPAVVVVLWFGKAVLKVVHAHGTDEVTLGTVLG